VGVLTRAGAGLAWAEGGGGGGAAGARARTRTSTRSRAAARSACLLAHAAARRSARRRTALGLVEAAAPAGPVVLVAGVGPLWRAGGEAAAAATDEDGVLARGKRGGEAIGTVDTGACTATGATMLLLLLVVVEDCRKGRG
jgi:hypothetical protein